MIAYADTSALVKLTVEEAGTEEMQAVWRQPIPVAVSIIGHPELACAFAAAVRDRRTSFTMRDVEGRIEGILRRLELVQVDEGLAREAGRVGTRHGLRALDAIHLASALSLTETEPTLVSWDERLRDAAVAEGLPIYP